MKLKFILLYLTAACALFGQEKGQSIELPDFVIMGIQSVSIPEMEKGAPELYPPLGSEYFTPQFSPEDFSLGLNDVSDSEVLKQARLRDKFRGLLTLGAGTFTMPTGSLYLNANFDNMMAGAKVWGFDEKESEDYLGYNASGAEVKTTFFLSNKNAFLPGLQINAGGSFLRDVYEYEGGNLPVEKRDIYDYKVNFGFRSDYTTTLRFGASAEANVFSVDMPGDLRQKSLFVNAYSRIILGDFSINGEANFDFQDVNYGILGDKTNLFREITGLATFDPITRIRAEAGIYYGGVGDLNLMQPRILLESRINENLTLNAFYNPEAEFVTVKEHIRFDRFYTPEQDEYYNLNKQSLRLGAGAEINYFKYFEFNVRATIGRYSRYSYFELVPGTGNRLFTTDEVNFSELYADAIFHKGPLGEFFGSLHYRNFKNAEKYYIPYIPRLSFEAAYSYYFINDLKITGSINYYDLIYRNLRNKDELPSFVSLGVSADYKLNDNLTVTLDINNLLNRKNYLLYEYLRKPFDAVAGVAYRW